MAKNIVVGACPHDCPDTCSILTTVEDGKAIAVRGNPDHPFTKGRLCVKVNNYEERVYSEARVLYPLKRVGPKGSASFARISWDEALAEIAARWKAIIAESGAQARASSTVSMSAIPCSTGSVRQSVSGRSAIPLHAPPT